jgi:hypothetical protein
MKIYTYITLFVTVIVLLGSCSTKDSDVPITENDPSGDYSYTSYSKYYTDNGEMTEATSDGLMYVSWYQESTSITITVNPYIGFSYYIKGSDLESHGDTTTFKINYQVINVDGTDFKISGNKGVDVPNLGKYDGYYVNGKKIVYSFKSSNLDSYENTETYTEGKRINY